MSRVAMWRSSIAGSLLAIAVLAVGCGGGSSKSSGGAPGGGQAGGGQHTIKVGMVLIGPRNDKSFDQAAVEGAQEAARAYPQLKITAILDNRATEQQEVDAVQTLAPIDDVVIGVGGDTGAAFDVKAASYPKVTFLAIQANVQHYHPNVYPLTWDIVSPYIVGSIAGTLTKDHIVGYVGGANIPTTVEAENAFVGGVHRTSPSARILKNITGDFNDVSKAKAATSTMLAQGADVIFPFLDAGVVGSYAAARDAHKEIPLFKLDVQDCSTYPNMVGAEIVDTTTGIDKMLTLLVHNSLGPKGVTTFAGVQDPSLQRLVLCPKYAANKKVAAVLKTTVDGINSGKLKMPPNVLNPRPSGPYREGFNGQVHNAK